MHDVVQLAMKHRDLRKSLELRSWQYCQQLAYHYRVIAESFPVGPDAADRFPDDTARNTFAHLVADTIKAISTQMFAINNTGAAWICEPVDTSTIINMENSLRFPHLT